VVPPELEARDRATARFEHILKIAKLNFVSTIPLNNEG
jgi:hypothetical protein